MKIKLEPNAFCPVRAHRWDAGIDLRSTKNVVIPKLENVIIDTGVRVEIPKGMVGFVKSRSSLMKYGILTDGTIDSGYTGTIKVVLMNASTADFYVDAGDKIAQLVVCSCDTSNVELVDELEETERGSDGFGSTGK